MGFSVNDTLSLLSWYDLVLQLDNMLVNKNILCRNPEPRLSWEVFNGLGEGTLSSFFCHTCMRKDGDNIVSELMKPV